MHVKKGDKVMILAGKDKGKSGTILRALPKEGKIVVEGINVKKATVRSKIVGGKKEVVDKTFPIHISNVKKSDN